MVRKDVLLRKANIKKKKKKKKFEFHKIGISLATAEFLLDKAVTKEQNDNILKVIEVSTGGAYLHTTP